MNRTEVIQRIIDEKQADNYLEIGVADGTNFFPIKAKKKVAVDPKFTFSIIQKIKWSLYNYFNIKAQYYECTSDTYFSLYNNIYFDVVFIDGLHTYEQSLRDVNNSLSFLNKNGVIIIHDCSPPNWASAQPAESYKHASKMNLSGWTGEWCGDVWKTICYLRSFRSDLSVFVLDCDYGLGIITKNKPDNILYLNHTEINNMTYDSLITNRINLLNLKYEGFIYEFLKNL